MVTILHVGKSAVAIDPDSQLSQELKRCDVNGNAEVDIYETKGSWWEKLQQLRDDPARVGRNRHCIAEAFSRADVLSSAPKHHVMQVTAIELFLEAAPQLDQLIDRCNELRVNNTNDSWLSDDGDGCCDREYERQYFFSTVLPQMKAWQESDQIGHVARMFQGVVRYFEGDLKADAVWSERSAPAVKWVAGKYVVVTGAEKVKLLTTDQVPVALRGTLQRYANDLGRALYWLTDRAVFECNDCLGSGSHVYITDVI